MRPRMFLFSMVGALSMMLGLVGAPFAMAQDEVVTYRAELSPLNSDITGSDATGEATFTISGDELTIKVTVEGVPPEMMHIQHFHGFPEGSEESTCPVVPDDDTNGDGIIDLIETEPVAGTTMVPFHDDPVSLEILNDTYPVADADGVSTYEKTVSLSELGAAVEEAFPGQELDFDLRAVFIHGVPEDTDLPDTVASLEGVPAQVTLPIACGEISLVESGTPVAATPVGTPEATPAR